MRFFGDFSRDFHFQVLKFFENENNLNVLRTYWQMTKMVANYSTTFRIYTILSLRLPTIACKAPTENESMRGISQNSFICYSF